MFFQFFV